MKSIPFTIWIVGALLVIATLDAVPDPPAVNPGGAASAIVHQCDYCCDVIPRRCDALDGSDSHHLSWVLVPPMRERSHPSDGIVLTGQAADPSPPEA